MKQTLIITTLSLITAGLLIGCGSSSSSDETITSTGYFIDSAVEGVSYETSSGLKGVTDSAGRFQYHIGDSVALHIGNLSLGEAHPLNDGLITPATLSSDDEASRTLLLRTLQALDEDGNTSNGITIPSAVINSLTTLTPTDIHTLDEAELLALDSTLAQHLDHKNDGYIDVDETEAITHFDESMQTWHTQESHTNGSANGSDNGNGHDNGNGTSNSNGHDNGNGGTNGNGNGDRDRDHNGTTSSEGNESHASFDITIYPTSTLTQPLKDAIAYMGNEERLAYDIYLTLYDFHLTNSSTTIKQLNNIARKSEIQHIGIVQSIAQRYALTSSDLSNITTAVANNTVTPETMPRGTYGIQAIQDLYDALYAKGTQSKEDALMVGCMVEVTDINDLDSYITLAQDSNATDVLEAFEVLRNGSYTHYWVFDKGLKNLGVAEGCYVAGDSLLGEDKNGIYPQTGHGH